MNGERTVEAADEPQDRTAPSDRRLALAGVLRAVARRLRRDPVLAAPFAAVGALLAVADYLRRLDPIPATAPAGAGGGISVRYSIFPTGVTRTGRALGAVLDLELPYFAWAVGLEALLVVAVGIAGFATIALTLGVGVRDRPVPLLRYVSLAAGLAVAYQALGQFPLDPQGALPSAVALVAVLLVLVRLALTPAYLVAGRGIASAVRDSVAASRGIGWALLGLVVAVGLAAWGFAQIPVAGSFLSAAVAGTVQSVALGLVVRRRERSQSPL